MEVIEFKIEGKQISARTEGFQIEINNKKMDTRYTLTDLVEESSIRLFEHELDEVIALLTIFRSRL